MKRFFKIVGYSLVILMLFIYGVFYFFSTPNSDAEIREKFADAGVQVELTKERFQNFQYRKLSMFNSDSLPTLVFAHGTIGSCMDFYEYMIDSELRSRANFISYDRVGYNYNDVNPVQESIGFERDHFQHVYKGLNPKKVIKVGYSYGGPIVLADTVKTGKTILLAPAVYSKVEPMPFLIRIYQWKATRWLVPDIWKEASKEKLSHISDLKKFDKNWNENKNEIVVLHGDDDGIVPIENSKYLESIFPKNQLKFQILNDAGHGLVWTRFDEIKEQLIRILDEDFSNN